MPTFTDQDLGYEALLDMLGDMGEAAVFVGILQDKGGEMDEDGNITLAGYAAVNEFGTTNAGRNRNITIPERSFLRSTVDVNAQVYSVELQAAGASAVDAVVATRSADQGLAALDKALGRLGIRATRDVQQTIRDLRTPANAKSTLQRKYPGDNPLIDTGRMRQSISFAVALDGSEP